LSFPRSGRAQINGADDWQTFAVWLGLLGWSLQSCVEFGLYLPALAWPAFAFLGWLLGIRPTDTRRRHGNEAV
jgi:hypothetical protein